MAEVRIYRDELAVPTAARVRVFFDELLVPAGAPSAAVVVLYRDELVVPTSARVRIYLDALEVPTTVTELDIDVYRAIFGEWRPAVERRASGGSWVVPS